MFLTEQREPKPSAIPDSFAERHIALRENVGNNVFALADGSYGVVYELDGIYDEPLTKAQLDAEISTLFKAVREIIMPQVVVQICASQRELTKPLPKPHGGTEDYSYSKGLSENLSLL